MARDLKLEVRLQALDKASAPLQRIGDASSSAAKQLRATRDQIRALEDTQRKMSSFRKVSGDMASTAGKLHAAQQRVRDLKEQMRRGGDQSDKFKQEFTKANEAVRDLTQKLQGQRRTLAPHGKALRELGIDTGKLAENETSLKDKLDAANKSLVAQKDRLKALGDQQARIDNLKGALGNVKNAGANVLDKGRTLLTQGAVAGAAGGYLFKTQFLDRAAQFETYHTILKTVTGSEEKAAKAMAWVSNFAARTPYEMEEVLESFTRLSAYGIDPMNGSLMTMGDTASAMGKPIIQVVEAIADAVTGENERLKELGIRGSKIKGTKLIQYEYTNAAGETLTKQVDGSNRKLIQSTLQAIWNEKYKGAMEAQSKTWNGMVSNMSDQWARFTNMAMAAGLFDRMKERLGGVLEQVDRMADNGQLAAWADKVGRGMLKFGDALWQAGNAIVSLTSGLAEAVGGWRNLVYLLAAIKLIPLVASLVSLTTALYSAGSALAAVVGGSAAFIKASALISGAARGVGIALWGLAANPVVLAIAAAVGVLAGAAYLIYKNWDRLGPYFSTLWEEVKAGFSGGLGSVINTLANFSPIGLVYRAFAEVLNYLGLDLPVRFTDMGNMIVRGLINGLLAGLGQIKGAITTIGNSAIGWFKERLGIHSPSRVFAELGGYTMQGLEQGLSAGQRSVLEQMRKTGKQLTAAGMLALGGGVAGPAMAAEAPFAPQPSILQQELPASQLSALAQMRKTSKRLIAAGPPTIGTGVVTQSIQLDNSPSITARQAASAPFAPQISITVHAAPGMDEQAIGRAVGKHVEQIIRHQAARQRSALYDRE
ncbi:hypothetical protein D9M68_329990 [compost metagenome]